MDFLSRKKKYKIYLIIFLHLKKQFLLDVNHCYRFLYNENQITKNHRLISLKFFIFVSVSSQVDVKTFFFRIC